MATGELRIQFIVLLGAFVVAVCGFSNVGSASWDKMFQDAIKKGQKAVEKGVDDLLKKDKSSPPESKPSSGSGSKSQSSASGNAPQGDAPRYDKPWIREIQTRLKKVGLDPGPVDGGFGKKTANAIVIFQKISQMTPDGQPRPSVMKLLRERTQSVHTVSPGGSPTKTPSKTAGKKPPEAFCNAKAKTYNTLNCAGARPSSTCKQLLLDLDRCGIDPSQGAQPKSSAQKTEPVPASKAPAGVGAADPFHPLMPGGIHVGVRLGDAVARLRADGFSLYNRCTFRKRGLGTIDIELLTPPDTKGTGKKPTSCRNMGLPVVRIFHSMTSPKIPGSSNSLVARMNRLAGNESKCTELRDRAARCTWTAPPNDPNVKTASLSYIGYGKGTLTRQVVAVKGLKVTTQMPVAAKVPPPAAAPKAAPSSAKTGRLSFNPLAPVGIRVGMKSSQANAVLASAGYKRNGCTFIRRQEPNISRIDHYSGSNLLVCETGTVTNIKYFWNSPDRKAARSLGFDVPTNELVQSLNSEIGSAAHCTFNTPRMLVCDWTSPPNAPDVAKITVRYKPNENFNIRLVAKDQSGGPEEVVTTLKLKAPKSQYAVGELVTFEWRGLPSGRQALFEFVPEGSPVNRNYNDFRRGNKQWGNAAFRTRKAGRYEIRAYMTRKSDGLKPLTEPHAKLVVTVGDGASAATGGSSKTTSKMKRRSHYLQSGDLTKAAHAGGFEAQRRCQKNKQASANYAVRDCSCLGDKVRDFYLREPTSRRRPLNVAEDVKSQCPGTYKEVHAYFYKNCADTKRTAASPDLKPEDEKVCQCAGDYGAKKFRANPGGGVAGLISGSLVNCGWR